MTSGFDRPESTTALAAATLVPQSYDLLRPMSSRPSRPTERNVCSHCHTELGKTPSLRATALRPSPLSNTSAAAGLTPGPYVLIDKPPIPRTLVFCPRNRRRFTPSQRAISYFHSFTLVCRSAIPIGSSLAVSFVHLAAESLRVSSHRRLGQTLGQIRKLFRNRKPAVSFLSRGQKRQGFEVRNRSKGMPKRLFSLFGACLAK